MWFSLFAVVLILAITFYQGLQGLFSALITCVLTILSAALAFGLYEDLYYWQLIQYQPAHGRGIALMAIFVLSLLALRTVFDLIVKGNLQLPTYVDRGGGGVLGFVTAMLIVGMLSISIQMLPFAPSFLGFARYSLVDDTEKEVQPRGSDKDQRMFRANLDWSKVKHSRRTLWLNFDGFTVAMMGSLSNNALHGHNVLADLYPDLLRSLHNARSGHFRESRTVVGTDAITIEGYWDMPAGAFYTRQLINTGSDGSKKYELKLDKVVPEAGKKRVVVRVKIADDARDEDSYHRFTTEQFRLVGREGKDGPVQEFFLVGVNHEKYDRWVRLHRGEGVTRQQQGGPLRLDLVFEVPDRPEFVPLFVEYKQNARAEIRPPDEKAKKRPIKPLPPLKPKEEKKNKKGPGPQEEEQQPGAGTGKPMQDRVSGLGPARKESAFKNELPFALTQYGSLEVANGQVRGGHTVATLNNDWEPPAGNKPAVEAFDVPADKRLLQLSVDKLQPQSWLGNILGGAVDKIGNFYIIDSNNQNYPPVGHYAMAVVNGEPTFELRYLDETERTAGHLPKMEKIKNRDLEGNYCLFFLFHLPPGCKPVALHTGRTDVDLKDLNLVAPQ